MCAQIAHLLFTFRYTLCLHLLWVTWNAALSSSLLHCVTRDPVVVRFKAVGTAPIMKQNFYKITASKRFQAVIQFLRNQLGWKPGEPLVSERAAYLVSAHVPHFPHHA